MGTVETDQSGIVASSVSEVAVLQVLAVAVEGGEGITEVQDSVAAKGQE